MPQILTSWKEIAQFLGKGVRTVQRWEREADLPVRRQAEPSPHAVIAISDELEDWARSRTRGPTGALAGALQREIETLRAQNGELRARLDALESTVVAMSAAEVQFANPTHPPAAYLRVEEETLIRVERRIIATTGAPDAPGDTPSQSHSIYSAAQQGRALAVRARLSFASTLCSVLEGRTLEADRASLWRVQTSAQAIRGSLERPGYVPTQELNDLRSLLWKLVARIELIGRALAVHPDAAVLWGECGKSVKSRAFPKMALPS
jgi:hypothetical protein